MNWQIFIKVVFYVFGELSPFVDAKDDFQASFHHVVKNYVLWLKIKSLYVFLSCEI